MQIKVEEDVRVQRAARECNRAPAAADAAKEVGVVADVGASHVGDIFLSATRGWIGK